MGCSWREEKRQKMKKDLIFPEEGAHERLASITTVPYLQIDVDLQGEILAPQALLHNSFVT